MAHRIQGLPGSGGPGRSTGVTLQLGSSAHIYNNPSRGGTAAGWEADMTAVDQLLMLLLDGKGRIVDHLRLAGFTEDEVMEAWDQGRAAGFTESTGLGQDRLTEKGRARALRLV